MTEPLIARHLAFRYPGWGPTLTDASLAVDPGSITCVLGPSGAGKSTLLRLLAGLERPQAGAVLLGDTDVTRLPPHERGIGMMFQDAALFPHLNAWQNVAFALRYRRPRPADLRAEALRLLASVGIPQDRHNARVGELSGGQARRVALARTIAAGPRAILLDEPLSALDAALRLELAAFLAQHLRQAAIPCVWVTHDEAEARRIGDVRLRLQDGRLHPDAPTAA